MVKRLAFVAGCSVALCLATGCVDHWADLRAAAVSFEGNEITAVCGHYNVCIWNLQSGKLIRKLKTPSRWFSAVALSPNGKTLATGFDDGSVMLWSVADGSQLRSLTAGPESGWVLGLVFSHDASKLAATGMDASARIWETATGKLLVTLDVGSIGTQALAFSADDKLVACGNDKGLVRLFDANSGKLMLDLKSNRGYIFGLAFSHEGKSLAAASATSFLEIWNLNSGTISTTITSQASTLSAAAFSPDDKTLATVGWGAGIELWDRASGRELTRVQGDGNLLVFNPDGKVLVSGGADDDVKVRELPTGRVTMRFSCYREVWPWN